MRGLAASTSALLVAAAGTAAAADCYDGLYLIVARGTGEPKGPGSMGIIADDIAESIGDSKVLGLDYPATFSDPDYDDSETTGAETLQKVLTKYVGGCPDSKVAIMGYSQGAQLTSDAVCGGSSGLNNITALSSEIIETNVVAMVLFGDPSHIANTTYDRGTSIKDGIFAREDISGCEKYDDRLISYCDTGDVYCDLGNDEDVHGEYLEKYQDDVAKYIIDKYEAAASGSGSSTSATATSTATSTASGTTTVTGTTTVAATTTMSPTTSTTEPASTTSGEPASPTETDAGAIVMPGRSLIVTVPLLAAALVYHVL